MFGQRISLGRDTLKLNIPQKSKRVLKIILFCFLLITLRLWQLTVVLHEENLRKSLLPGKKNLLIPPQRGPITDRFGIPLAVNKIQYNISVLYSDLKDIPSIRWVQEEGKKIKTRPRADYIVEFSKFLGKELHMLPEDVEDIIYSKAALFHQVPYLLKKDVDERTFYRLKAAEKDWPGLHVDIHSKRYYPQEKVASSIIGYMGAISQQEYGRVSSRIRALREELEELENSPDEGRYAEVLKELEELENKAYSWNDAIGKGGVEQIFEQDLRGFYGKTTFETDARGNVLRKIPGDLPSIPGKKVTLSISSELQRFCEYLLARNEVLREGRSQEFDKEKRTYIKQKQPFIKGGAIVVMEPKSGEVLALASYPRYNPNDFIFSGNPKVEREKDDRVRKWLELESHIGNIWDQKHPLEREIGTEKDKGFAIEYTPLTWKSYLEFLFPTQNSINQLLQRPLTLSESYKIQVNIRSLLSISGLDSVGDLLNILYPKNPYRDFMPDSMKEQGKIALESAPGTTQKLLRELDPYMVKLSKNRDKLLFLDLCRLNFSSENLDSSSLLSSKIGTLDLGEHRQNSILTIRLLSEIRKSAKEGFHRIQFKRWREENQKAFLVEKRKEEKARGTYARPYLDYLNREESRQFREFWDANKNVFLAKLLIPSRLEIKDTDLQKTISYVIEKDKTLLPSKNLAKLRENLKGLEPSYLLSYLKTIRPFKELRDPLWGYYPQIRHEKGEQIEKHLASAFYPIYGYGYTRQHTFQSYSTQGSIFKVVTAYKCLIKYYEKLIKQGAPQSSLNHLNPLEIIEETKETTKGKIMAYRLNGTPVYQNYKGGRLIKSSHPNIGRLSMQKAFEVSSNVYFALLAADLLDDPEELNEAAKDFGYGEKTGIELRGEIAGNLPDDLRTNQTGLYAYTMGQHSLVVTPLQSAVALSAVANKGAVLSPKVLSHLEGLHPDFQKLGIYNPVSDPFVPYYKGIGLHFPLFHKTGYLENQELSLTPNRDVRWNLFMPSQIRTPILQGLSRFVHKSQTEGLWGISRYFTESKEAIRDFTSLKNQLVGKTSTSESVELVDLDLEKGKGTYNHIWFGGISFKETIGDALLKDPFENPELVVIVYLKYGGWGKEAAPLAAQVVKKWREIEKRVGKNVENLNTFL